MNTKKKVIIFIISAIIIGSLIALFLILFPKKTGQETGKNNPLDNSSLTPSLFPSPTAANQGQTDKNFSNQINRVYTSFPWYEKLPITTDNYFLYFDPDSKRFVAKIYDASNQLGSNELAGIENKIRQTVSGFGEDAQKYPIDFKTGY